MRCTERGVFGVAPPRGRDPVTTIAHARSMNTTRGHEYAGSSIRRSRWPGWFCLKVAYHLTGVGSPSMGRGGGVRQEGRAETAWESGSLDWDVCVGVECLSDLAGARRGRVRTSLASHGGSPPVMTGAFLNRWNSLRPHCGVRSVGITNDCKAPVSNITRPDISARKQPSTALIRFIFFPPSRQTLRCYTSTYPNHIKRDAPATEAAHGTVTDVARRQSTRRICLTGGGEGDARRAGQSNE